MALLNSFFKIIAVCQVLSITNLLAYNASGAEKKSAFFGPNLPLASGKIRLSGPQKKKKFALAGSNAQHRLAGSARG